MNSFYNAIFFQFQGIQVNYKTYEDLLEVQRSKQLMVSCRLTDDMLHPNNFQKMGVRFAARLLSNTNSVGLFLYRTFDATTQEEKRIKQLFAGNEVFPFLSS